jgi:hypothetical protein
MLKFTQEKYTNVRSAPMFVRLVVLFAIIFTLGGCTLDQEQEFTYQVRVRDADTGQALPNVGVTLEIQASNLAPLVEYSDSLGLARLLVPDTYVGRPGRLLVELAGYGSYTRFVDVRAGQLPENVFLRQTSVGLIVPTNEPTLPPTNTPSPQPTDEPTDTPTPEPIIQPTIQPSHTPSPEPTSEPSNTPTAEPTSTPTATPEGLFTVETIAYLKAYAAPQAVPEQAVAALPPGRQLHIIRVQAGYGGAEWYAVRLAPGLIGWVDACFTEPLRVDVNYQPRPCDISP